VQATTQAKGKIERWHRSLKSECLRPGVPLTLEDAQRLVHNYVNYYNGVRLQSAIGYVAPHDRLHRLAGVIPNRPGFQFTVSHYKITNRDTFA
jgi:transposase InsO family protein